MSNVNITLAGAASEHGVIDENGMLVLAVNATTNGSIYVNAEKPGYENATNFITAIPGLDISTSPSSITSGTATYVTLSVTVMGKPVEGAAINLTGAGVAFESITDSSGQIITQINAQDTGKINVTAKKVGYSEGSTAITSIGQQALSISSSHSTLIVNVPTYVTLTVTAGGLAVNDTVISLSGAATGSGTTNQDGKTVILITPQTTGTVTASASKTGFSSGSTTITSASTQSLSIASNTASITAGTQAYVMFTVKSGNDPISEAAVTLTGAATGNGITNQNGQAIIQINSTGTGTITASASKTGYTAGSTSLTASGQQTLSVSASPPNITNGVATYVTFTVTSSGQAISSAAVSVSGGGISADGMTNSAGQATLQLNAANTGIINVVTRKAGYIDGLMTIAH